MDKFCEIYNQNENACAANGCLNGYILDQET